MLLPSPLRKGEEQNVTGAYTARPLDASLLINSHPTNGVELQALTILSLLYGAEIACEMAPGHSVKRNGTTQFLKIISSFPLLAFFLENNDSAQIRKFLPTSRVKKGQAEHLSITSGSIRLAGSVVYGRVRFLGRLFFFSFLFSLFYPPFPKIGPYNVKGRLKGERVSVPAAKAGAFVRFEAPLPRLNGHRSAGRGQRRCSSSGGSSNKPKRSKTPRCKRNRVKETRRKKT